MTERLDERDLWASIPPPPPMPRRVTANRARLRAMGVRVPVLECDTPLERDDTGRWSCPDCGWVQ